MSLSMPQGFSVSSKKCHLRSHGSGEDVTFFQSETPAHFGIVTTQNHFVGEPIVYCRSLLADPAKETMRGILIHVGQANVGTGQIGAQHVLEMAQLAAHEIQTVPQDIFVLGTGVIGQPVKIEAFTKYFPAQDFKNNSNAFEKASEAIMTTDTRPKIESITLGNHTILGIAKGSGMIEPNMATMLSVLLTDAEIHTDILQTMLKRVVDKTFNRVSVDSDTSTSDAVCILANGEQGPVDLFLFEEALEGLCRKLARSIALDGEGATKLLTVKVEGAESPQSAQKIAKSIVNSPLVKSAIFGQDGNWGRIAMAAGKAGEKIDPELMKISIGSITVYEGLPATAEVLEPLADYLQNETEIIITVDVKVGLNEAEVWGCDLSYDYVKINADYRT